MPVCTLFSSVLINTDVYSREFILKQYLVNRHSSKCLIKKQLDLEKSNCRGFGMISHK